VGPVVVTAQGRLVSCLWAHPVAGSTMTFTIPAGPGAVSLWLQFADDALKDAPHPPVEAVLTADGTVLKQASCTNTGSGRCPLGTTLPDGETAVTLSLSTTDAARQLVCLGGEVARP
jgi:hypothetical protein